MLKSLHDKINTIDSEDSYKKSMVRTNKMKKIDPNVFFEEDPILSNICETLRMIRHNK